jgi:hypothetical protein
MKTETNSRVDLINIRMIYIHINNRLLILHCVLRLENDKHPHT